MVTFPLSTPPQPEFLDIADDALAELRELRAGRSTYAQPAPATSDSAALIARLRARLRPAGAVMYNLIAKASDLNLAGSTPTAGDVPRRLQVEVHRCEES